MNVPTESRSIYQALTLFQALCKHNRRNLPLEQILLLFLSGCVKYMECGEHWHPFYVGSSYPRTPQWLHDHTLLGLLNSACTCPSPTLKLGFPQRLQLLLKFQSRPKPYILVHISLLTSKTTYPTVCWTPLLPEGPTSFSNSIKTKAKPILSSSTHHPASGTIFKCHLNSSTSLRPHHL